MCYFPRKQKFYLITGVSPTIVDKGLIEGKSQLVVDKNFTLLNKEIQTTIWLGKKTHTLAQHVTHIKEEVDNECGLYSPINTPCLETSKLYQLLTVNDAIDVHLVKTRINKIKVSVVI